jgi:hypothetical protein
MNTNRRLGLFFAFGIAFAIYLGWPDLCHGATDPFLEGKLKILESKIDGWEHSASITGTLIFVTVLVGIVVAAMQPASNWWVMKIVIASLSVIAAALGAFNHQFFPADDRVFAKAARQARVLVNAFELQLAKVPKMDDSTRDSLYDAFQKLFEQVEKIEESIYGSGGGAAPLTGIDLLTNAYAASEQGAPDWVNNVPTDEKNFYFLGQAKGKSFDEAKKGAIAQAEEAATESFAKMAKDSPALKDKPDLIAQLIKAVISGGETVQTFVQPNAASGDFTGYVLLRISKAPARFAAESVFVRKSEPYDKAFLQRVQPKDEK